MQYVLLREQISKVKDNIEINKIKISEIIWISYGIIRQIEWSKDLGKDLYCTELVEQVWFAIKCISRESQMTQWRKTQRIQP